MTRILLTGGAGFIGSHVAERILAAFPDAHLIVLDKMTYAADFRNLTSVLEHSHAKLVVGDVCDLDVCRQVTLGVDLVLNLAAESHVDNSFGNSLHFSHTNVVGTHTLIEACRANKVSKIIHVSTDEVYGEIANGSFGESSILNPTNPYSASKAAAEMIVRGYWHSFGLPVMTVRGNNIFGARQYPEKIIPKFMMQLHRHLRLTVHGDGSNVRSYLSVHDFADALVLLIECGKAGEIYNVGSTEEYSNLHIANVLCELFEKDPQEYISFVNDRQFNDRRYSVDSSKIEALGWRRKRDLMGKLPEIVAWYRENADRYRDVPLG